MFQVVLKLWYIFYSTLFILYKFKYKAMLFIIMQPLCYQLLFHLFKNKYVLWFYNLLWIMLVNYMKTFDVNDLNLNLTHIEFSVVISASYWIGLRCLYYYLMKISCKLKNESILDCLCYCFYLPTLFTGPFLIYNNYKECFVRNTKTVLARSFELTRNLIRFIFWLFFIEFLLHYVYLNVYAYYPEVK